MTTIAEILVPDRKGSLLRHGASTGGTRRFAATSSQTIPRATRAAPIDHLDGQLDVLPESVASRDAPSVMTVTGTLAVRLSTRRTAPRDPVLVHNRVDVQHVEHMLGMYLDLHHLPIFADQPSRPLRGPAFA